MTQPDTPSTNDADQLPRHTTPTWEVEMLISGAAVFAMLDCLTALHAVSLDGKLLSPLHYDVTSDTRTSRPALQTMIDVRALASGRHELRVARGPAPTHHRSENKAWTIAFWR